MIFSRAEKIYAWTCLILLALCGIGLLYNAIDQHYPLNLQIFIDRAAFFVLFSIVYCGLLLFPQKTASKQLLRIAKTSALTINAIALMGMISLVTLCAPGPMHDHVIDNVDRAMRFHLLPILRFMFDHPWIRPPLMILYFAPILLYQALPFFLTLTEESHERILVFFTATNIALITGHLIFYFYPTMTSPAAIYPHQYFTHFELATYHAFKLEHYHHAVNFKFLGGVISFPSFHAIWITMLAYFLWPKFGKWAIFFAAIAIYAVLFTGWHYFADMIAGVIIAYFSIKLSEYLIVDRSISLDLLTNQSSL